MKPRIKHRMPNKLVMAIKWEAARNCCNCCFFSTAFSFHLTFELEHFLWISWWACKLKTLSVGASERGACVNTCMHNSFLWPVTSLRLMVRNVWQEGNRFGVFKAQIENVRFYVNPSLRATLTSLGRGSWVYGWTSAPGCIFEGGGWLLNGSSISPPDWWVSLQNKGTHEHYITHNKAWVSERDTRD